MARTKQTAADYIEAHDDEMRVILGELAEHAGKINMWWTFAVHAARNDPDQALTHLTEAETHLDIHVRIELADGLRRIRSALSRIAAELADRDDQANVRA